MKQKLEEKYKAVSLRKKGLSYKEIMEIIPVAKGTLSGWLQRLPLSDDEISLLYKRSNEERKKARDKASFTNRKKRLERDKVNFEFAEKEFKRNKSNPLFFLGIILYWCEGTKKSNFFSFINSDPEMVYLMDKWTKAYLEPYFGKPRYRLFIHIPYKDENCERFWSRKLKLRESDFQKTIFKPTPYKIKKNPEYKGCLRITFTKVNSLRTVLAWQKLLLEYYNSLMHP